MPVGIGVCGGFSNVGGEAAAVNFLPGCIVAGIRDIYGGGQRDIETAAVITHHDNFECVKYPVLTQIHYDVNRFSDIMNPVIIGPVVWGADDAVGEFLVVGIVTQGIHIIAASCRRDRFGIGHVQSPVDNRFSNSQNTDS